MPAIAHSLCIVHNRQEMLLSSPSNPPTTLTGVSDYKKKEFTSYQPNKRNGARFRSSLRRSDCSSEFEAKLGKSKTRAVVCSCFQRRKWSFTVRRITETESGEKLWVARTNETLTSGYLPETKR